MSDFMNMQEVSANGGETNVNADSNFENASARKKKRVAKRTARKAKRQEKRAKRVAKKNPKRANRIAKRSAKNYGKSAKATHDRRKMLSKTKPSLRNMKREKARLQQAKIDLANEEAKVKAIETESGETIEPQISEDGNVVSPQVAYPIENDGEQINPEITTYGEVMTPEIIETPQEPIENEDGSMQVGEETIQPEVAEDGEVFPVELVGEDEGADGETYYRILKYNKIPALKNADGSSIMPFQLADGSVVLGHQMYSSATGEIETSADGDVTIKNPQLIASADSEAYADGEIGASAGFKVKFPSWAKWVGIGLLVVGGIIVYKKYIKKK